MSALCPRDQEADWLTLAGCGQVFPELGARSSLYKQGQIKETLIWSSGPTASREGGSAPFLGIFLKPGNSALLGFPKDLQGRVAPEPQTSQTLTLRPSPLSVALLAACLWPLSFLGPRQARKMGLGQWPRLDKALGLPACPRLPDAFCQGTSGTMNTSSEKHSPSFVSPLTKQIVCLSKNI